MTNLTSEQYRDILHNVEGATHYTPTVQILIRRAVETFYTHFRCYPNAASAAPGSETIFGEQIQFDGGSAFALPIQMATVIVGRKVAGRRVTIVTTADVEKPRKVSFGLSECPLIPTGPEWLNIIKGTMAAYCCGSDVTAFEAAVETSLPIGIGLGSAAALSVATYTLLELMFGVKASAVEKAVVCQRGEAEFTNRPVGIVPRLSAAMAADRNATIVDTTNNSVDWIPVNTKQVVFVSIDAHVKDILLGDEYPSRARYLRKACDILQTDCLRGLTDADLAKLEVKIRNGIRPPEETVVTDEEEEADPTVAPNPSDRSEFKYLIDEDWNAEKLETVLKRARFYVMESRRVDEAKEAWQESDVVSFGRKMTESHNELVEDYGFVNPVLQFIVDTALTLEGVLGAKMTGLGLDHGGSVLALLYREYLCDFCQQLQILFRLHANELFSQLKDLNEKTLEDEEEKEEEEEVEEEEPPPIVQEEKPQEVQKEKKKKRKCDPSEKLKKKLERQEAMRLAKLAEEEELERLRLEEEIRRQQEFAEQRARELAEGMAQAEAQDAEEETPRLDMYLLSPIAGARMIFPLKTDLLRNRRARVVPQAKELVKRAVQELWNRYGLTAEAVGLAPATATLFGEFLEYNMGFAIHLALPLLTVVAGARCDSVMFEMKTSSTEVGDRLELRAPVHPSETVYCTIPEWGRYAVGTVSEFRGRVPGFVSTVESSVPCETGLHSCSAFQASIYTFLESLTNTCTSDPMEKAERCLRGASRIVGDEDLRCSTLRFLPTFLCREGYVLFVNADNFKMANYYLDNPSYVFLLACCKENSSGLSPADIVSRVKACQRATEILGKKSLAYADERHMRCLFKRGASDQVIRCARYVASEQMRCIQAIDCIKRDDYENLGRLMTESHYSLRDDFDVSSREIEVMVGLALGVEGVLGAKLIGRGLVSTVLILARLSSVDECIRHVRANYEPKSDKPFFYVFKPSSGAFTMDPSESEIIP